MIDGPQRVRKELNSGNCSKRATVGLLGLGAIGLSVVQLLSETSGPKVVGSLVRCPGVRANVHDIPIVYSLNELLDLRPDVVAEVAGHTALKTYGPAILRSHCDLVITSIGALADRAFFAELEEAAATTGRSVEIVAGAIGALDAIATAAVGRLDSVTYLARRPPDQSVLNVESVDPNAEMEIFSGSAREAALRYPDELNVAATLGLAGLGLDRTEVRVVVDPKVEVIHHEIGARGQFGELKLSIVNSGAGSGRPSRLVAMSVVRALQFRSGAPIRIV